MFACVALWIWQTIKSECKNTQGISVSNKPPSCLTSPPACTRENKLRFFSFSLGGKLKLLMFLCKLHVLLLTFLQRSCETSLHSGSLSDWELPSTNTDYGLKLWIRNLIERFIQQQEVSETWENRASVVIKLRLSTMKVVDRKQKIRH